jgi:anti-sigma28 factor (negative regulator of flagellin synthesis)
MLKVEGPMLKKSISLIILGMISLISCGKKPAEQKDQAPGLRNYTAPLKQELSSQHYGEWENCSLSEDKQKSIYKKIILGSGLEIKESIYSDKFCQMIESTKESTIISYYYFEKDRNLLKAKIQERKQYLYDKSLIQKMNEIAHCGYTDWEIKNSKDILGVFCTGNKKISKYDYFEFSVMLESNILYFDSTPYLRKKDNHSSSNSRGYTLLNETDSEIVPEKNKSNIMLVFPPRKAEFEVEVKTHFGTNLDQCEKVYESYLDSLSRLEKIKNLKEEIKNLKLEIDTINVQINQIAENFLKFLEENKLEKYDEISRKIIENNILLVQYEENYKRCKENCEGTRQKILELKLNQKELKELQATISISWSQRRSYNNFLEEIEDAEGEIQKVISEINQTENEIEKMLDQYKRIFLKYSSIKGPLSHIYFKSKWEENLKKLIVSNPNFKFRMAEIGKTSLEYRIKGLPIYPAAGSIMGLPLNGAKEPFKGRIIFSEFPTEIQGRVQISLLAACPAYRPEDYQILLTRPHTLTFEALFDY